MTTTTINNVTAIKILAAQIAYDAAVQHYEYTLNGESTYDIDQASEAVDDAYAELAEAVKDQEVESR